MPKKSKKLSYEEAILKLEEVVETMEDSNIKIEDSLNLYKDAIDLIGYCHEKLKKIQNEVVILKENLNDNFTEENFLITADEDDI